MISWLLNETPSSRHQAAWGELYRAWLVLRRNHLAVLALFLLVIIGLMSLAAPWLTSQNPAFVNTAIKLAPSSAAHWLGTDNLGQDIYTRLLYGGRITLGIVVAVIAIVAPFGLIIGVAAGYAGGILDQFLMRICDIFLAFPRLILALAFVAALRPGVTSAIIAITLTAWPPYARLARADTLTLRNTDFVAAARLNGASGIRIVLRHLLPLCLPGVIVRATLDMSGIILTVAGLGFLGMGAQPPLPEWGTMVATTQGLLLDQWWVPIIPGIAIFVVSLAFNLLGDGLRDVLDPKQR